MKRYSLNPSSFSLVETEEFYERKAKKGLILEKRGHYLSRFRKEEPKNLSYRVEIVDDKRLEDGKIPEEQILVYEECGWSHVCGKRQIQIFSAEKDTDPPELYTNPEDQIESIKILRKSFLKEFLSMIVTYAILFAIQTAGYPKRSVGAYLRFISDGVYKVLIDTPAFGFLLFGTIALGIGYYVVGMISSQYLILKLKKGVPLRTITPFEKVIRIWKKGVVAVFVSAVLILGLIEGSTSVRGDTPSSFEGPFVTLEKLHEGEFQKEESSDAYEGKYRSRKTIFGEVIKTQEFSDRTDGYSSLDQEVYLIKSQRIRDRLLESLKVSLYYGIVVSDFEEVIVDGLDEVYVRNKWEIVAVKGDLVLRTFYHTDKEPSRESILLKISESLNDTSVSRSE
ncbi:DUF2812 domain-containing protein [Proteiniclasticum ruminis]|uniref:DUF2812 domain-containing protein n=1 Tax=Proteiniclasticum ruminis TaxID=398199 RepID=A0A1G8LHJ8_9CLOT|nr:DUF2812 domain-containing protein [Proteiniclasticum ruminis]SDI55088.1 Protein of unknown function [Proteiniclasticum ruminis]